MGLSGSGERAPKGPREDSFGAREGPEGQSQTSKYKFVKAARRTKMGPIQNFKHSLKPAAGPLRSGVGPPRYEMGPLSHGMGPLNFVMCPLRPGMGPLTSQAPGRSLFSKKDLTPLVDFQG